jgi:hypothetical protein
MKSMRFIFTALVLMSPSVATFAQSDAQKSFDKHKALAGTWEARVTTNPPEVEMGDGALRQISLRVTFPGKRIGA